MKLTSIINPDLIFFNLKGQNRGEIYSEMLDLAARQLDFTINTKDFCTSMIEREELTKIPYEGMAIPHLRVHELNDLYIIIGIPQYPFRLKDNDLADTGIIIMSLISDKTSDTYLKMLAAFSAYALKQNGVDKLAAAEDKKEFISILDADKVQLKSDICAEDIMKVSPTSVGPEDSLAHALDIFTRESISQIPVVDKNNKILGVIDGADIIRRSIPEYILMMDNLNFIKSFEPFEKILKEEDDRVVKNFIIPADSIIDADTPVIQFTVSLVRNEARRILVCDKEKKLLGTISIHDLIHKILRA